MTSNRASASPELKLASPTPSSPTLNIQSSAVVVSYSVHNQKLYERLKEALEKPSEHASGAQPIILIDDSQLKPGAPWERTFARTMQEADVLLLLLSDHYFASEYCAAELDPLPANMSYSHSDSSN